MGKMVADIISKTEKLVVAEGQEPPEFWVALGGKTSYANSKRYELCVPSPSMDSPSAPQFLGQLPWQPCLPTRLQEENLSVPPRLFECSNKTGRFLATEIVDFTQDDLDENDVYLLDTWDQVCRGGKDLSCCGQTHVPNRMKDLQQPEVVGGEHGNPIHMVFIEDGLPAPILGDRFCVPSHR